MDKSNLRKTQAEAFRTTLLLGLFGTEVVVKWADGIIDEDAKPDVSMIDIAMAGDRSTWEVADLLAAVPGVSTVDHVRCLVLRAIRDHLRATPVSVKRMCELLITVATEGLAPNEKLRDRIYIIEDRLELAERGTFGDLDEVRMQVLSFLDDLCAAAQQAVAADDELDPFSWTPNERRIPWQRWKTRRNTDGRGARSLTSSRQGQ